jgi:hypothetical protein
MWRMFFRQLIGALFQNCMSILCVCFVALSSTSPSKNSLISALILSGDDVTNLTFLKFKRYCMYHQV